MTDSLSMVGAFAWCLKPPKVTSTCPSIKSGLAQPRLHAAVRPLSRPCRRGRLRPEGSTLGVRYLNCLPDSGACHGMTGLWHGHSSRFFKSFLGSFMVGQKDKPRHRAGLQETEVE